MKKAILGGIAAVAAAVGLSVIPAANAHAADMSYCENETWVNEITTCPFAHNVTDAWFASPGNQIGAYSPALDAIVIMDCAYVNTGYLTGEVCRGGNHAVVVFHP